MKQEKERAKRTSARDFGLEDDGEDDEEAGEKTMGALAKKVSESRF